MPQPPHYKQSLIEVREMLADVDLYEIARKLRFVFDDDEFWSDTRAGDEFEAADHLDRELDCINVEFLELDRALELFPDRNKWSGGSIREILKEARKQSERKGGPRSRVAGRPRFNDDQKLLFPQDDLETSNVRDRDA